MEKLITHPQANENTLIGIVYVIDKQGDKIENHKKLLKMIGQLLKRMTSKKPVNKEVLRKSEIALQGLSDAIKKQAGVIKNHENLLQMIDQFSKRINVSKQTGRSVSNKASSLFKKPGRKLKKSIQRKFSGPVTNIKKVGKGIKKTGSIATTIATKRVKGAYDMGKQAYDAGNVLKEKVSEGVSIFKVMSEVDHAFDVDQKQLVGKALNPGEVCRQVISDEKLPAYSLMIVVEALKEHGNKIDNPQELEELLKLVIYNKRLDGRTLEQVELSVQEHASRINSQELSEIIDKRRQLEWDDFIQTIGAEDQELIKRNKGLKFKSRKDWISIF